MRRIRPPPAPRLGSAALTLLLLGCCGAFLYLRAWLFEGLVRVAVNGRLGELRFYARQPLDCPLQAAAAPGAYVTALGTAGYLPGVRVLAQALRQYGAAFPLVVLLPDDLPAGTEQPLLDDAAVGSPYVVSVLRVRRLRYAKGWTTAGCRYWWLNAAGHYAELEHSLLKLHALALTQFQAIVWLDADVLPLRAPDELFGLAAARSSSALPLFAAAPDWGRHGGDAPGFNAGVFVATPCAALVPELQALAASPAHAHAARCHRRGTADQPLLQYYFGLDALGLPLRYNVLQPGLLARPALAATYPPVMLHFTKLKPWEAHGDAAGSAQPGVAAWAAVCAQIRCCEAAGACGPPKTRLPRGPHWEQSRGRAEA